MLLYYSIYAVTVFFASVVSVISGFGFSTITLAVLTLFIQIKSTLLFVGILHFLGNIYKVWQFVGGWNQITLPFIIGGTFCSFIGALLSGYVSNIFLKQILGIFLILYPVLVWYRPQMQLSQKMPFALLGGSLSGFFAGLIGMGGAIRSFFLSFYNLPKEVYIATSGMVALPIDLIRLGVYSYIMPQDLYDQLYLFIVCLPALWIGLWVGKKLVISIPQQYFRLTIAFFLAGAGLFHIMR